jgi:hypothetical protein
MQNVIDGDMQVCDMSEVPNVKNQAKPFYDKIIRNLSILKGSTKALIVSQQEAPKGWKSYLPTRVKEAKLGRLRTCRKDNKIYMWLNDL